MLRIDQNSTLQILRKVSHLLKFVSPHEEAPLITEKAAWYDKEKVAFSDLLKAVRVVLWKDNLFFRKEFSDPSVKIQLQDEGLKKSVSDFLVRMLMQAA